MSNGRITQLVWLGMITTTIGVWYSILNYGFFTTTMCLIIVSALTGIIIKLKENR